MAKAKSYYFCNNCGYQSASWLGRCPECGAWNSFEQEVVQTTNHKNTGKREMTTAEPMPLKEVSATESERMNTNSTEFDRVLGGGLVTGSLTLLGGEPGIGKSTLLLQTALNMGNYRLLYVSGEESIQQIKMRADRIAEAAETLYVLAETNVEAILRHVEEMRPEVVVIDSIQTMTTESIESAASSISQIRECTSIFQRLAKSTGVPILLIGHITKDGTLAGPKIMEHIVDTVLQFEGDRHHGYRILRALKNRFGSTAEIGIFEMLGNGLREVSNPSQLLMPERDEGLSGTAIAATLEGLRPIFIEVQSLVSTAVYGTPQRNANGFDMRRMNMLLAILEKRCGFKLGAKDVFLNIAGGLRVSDPAIDLAVACSILSSNVDIPLSSRVCLAAEMGLSGELRPVGRIEQRIAEAERMGFEQIIISKYNQSTNMTKGSGLKVSAVETIDQAFRLLFA